jgi:hypothetical protein
MISATSRGFEIGSNVTGFYQLAARFKFPLVRLKIVEI